MEDRFNFRFWDKDRKKMFNCIQINFTENAHGSNSLKDNESSIHLMYQPHLILMQSTGLKDKNGKLIFEGDILFYKIGSNKCREVVTWNQQQCGWIKGYQDLCTYQKHCEVIGNIYENANLLEEKCLN